MLLIGLLYMRYSSRQMVSVLGVVGERIPCSMRWLSSLGWQVFYVSPSKSVSIAFFITQLVHFYCETFLFLRDVLPENYPAFEIYNDFIHSWMFRRVMIFSYASLSVSKEV